VCGQVYSSPTRDAIYSTIASLSSSDVLLIVKNYTGDKLNFGLAAQMAQTTLGKKIEIVTVADDVALLDSKTITIGARGIAGVVLVHKILGAASASGLSLSDLKSLGDLISGGVKTFGVSLSSCNLPSSKNPMFEMPEGTMEIGLGIHGEKGLGSQPRETADSIVETLLQKLCQHIPAPESNTPLAIMMNNLGSTTNMELAVLSRATIQRLSSQGYNITRFYVGQFLTAMETAGISISVLPVDDKILGYLDAPSEMSVSFGPGKIDISDYLYEPSSPSHLTSSSSDSSADSSSKLLKLPVIIRGPESSDSCAQISNAIRKVCSMLQSQADYLTDLDSKVGDGDLGTNLSIASADVLRLLPSWNSTHPATLLTTLAFQLGTSLGGTSGPLYSVFFLNMANAIASIENGQLDAKAWVNAALSGSNGISSLGGANPGDRTMMDALLPAIEALKSSADLSKASIAASEGSNKTSEMIPRKGRSSYLQERALGVVDPGSAAVALIFQEIAK
jgi:dihydroxyacetone kinase